MIARASGFGKGVGRVSRPLRGVGVLAMPDTGLDTTRRVESVCGVSAGTGVLQLLVSDVVAGAFDDRRCVVHRVEVMS